MPPHPHCYCHTRIRAGCQSSLSQACAILLPPLYFFAHPLLSAQEGLHWWSLLKSHPLWVQNCPSRVLGKVGNKTKKCMFARGMLSDSTEPSSTERSVSENKVHFSLLLVSVRCRWCSLDAPYSLLSLPDWDNQDLLHFILQHQRTQEGQWKSRNPSTNSN